MKGKRFLAFGVFFLFLCICCTSLATTTAATEDVQIVKVAVGHRGCLALDVEGRVYAWGNDSAGKGILDVPKDLPPVKDIGMGTNSAVALDYKGKLHAWGSAGDGETSFQENLPPFIAIAVGDFQTSAFTADGRVYTWGAPNQGGQKVVPKRMSAAKLLKSGAYVSATLDAQGKVTAWFGKKIALRQTVPAIDIAPVGKSVAYLGNDGKIYGDAIQEHPGTTLLRPQPSIQSVVQLVGGGNLLGAIDAKDQVYLWGEYEWDESKQPLWNAPSNLPPITQMVISDSRVICLGADGKVYEWNSMTASRRSVDAVPIPDAFNGFLTKKASFQLYRYPAVPDIAYVTNAQELIDAVSQGTSTIVCQESFDLNKDIWLTFDTTTLKIEPV